MDDFDAFIDYVDTTDEPGEVTVRNTKENRRFLNTGEDYDV
jgi:hypothetical protein